MGKKYVKFDGEYGQVDLTSGKVYGVVNEICSGVVDIVDDNGDRITVRAEGKCQHLNGYGSFYFCGSGETKYVRPAMTPEARDILNSIHETVGAETRSDSIVEFMDKHTEMEVELCAVKVQLSTLEEQSKRRIEHLDERVGILQNRREVLVRDLKSSFGKLIEEKNKKRGWMIYSAIVAAYAIGVSIYCLIGG